LFDDPLCAFSGVPYSFVDSSKLRLNKQGAFGVMPYVLFEALLRRGMQKFQSIHLYAKARDMMIITHRIDLSTGEAISSPLFSVSKPTSLLFCGI
jgi:hypothetical protein